MNEIIKFRNNYYTVRKMIQKSKCSFMDDCQKVCSLTTLCEKEDCQFCVDDKNLWDIVSSIPNRFGIIIYFKECNINMLLEELKK